MEWIKDLSLQQASKRTKILLLSGAAGAGISFLAYAYYKHSKNINSAIPPKVAITGADVPVEANSSSESLSVELEMSSEGWVTPTASNEKLVCRVVNVDDDMDDESPRKEIDNQRQPVESDSFNDGFEEQKLSRKVLILGLEDSGKSALLSQLSKEGKDCVDYEPTKGFNVVCISFENMDLNIWEIGGGLQYRSYWRNFCASTDLILFAVDSTDPKKFPIAKHYLNEILTEVNEQSDFNIIATKADKQGSATAEEIQTALGLDGMKINIMKVAVKTGGAEANIGLDDVQKCCLYDLED